ncbi:MULTISPECIES: flagellin [Clostridium]|uniref:flagellin N-terminal helical domain-containing protein n=1 Tax=Clostridium TaxID=1485 RepID=UPI00257F0AEA|nr:MULTISPECIES: flagellin [Clostridium]MBS4840282.1 flagellin [Clostridium sp.]MDU1401670.1 flagellin [Clostridium sp.]MDU1601448.1 flagellin [Clostridium sp.]MDU2894623.1 flagellin [Clostridium sp.]MDU3006466.1 flagellin [Clostridium sp.]
MIINHNMNAMNAHRNSTINTTAAGKSMEKLSSGLRINRAGDDAAGLSISEKMRGQIRGLDQASRNSADGISMIQTAEGALQETHSILQRMRELSVQSANDTNVSVDRTAIKDEMTQLAAEIGRIKDNTQFNEQNLLDGTSGTGGKVQIHVGANKDQKMELDFTTKGINLDAIHTSVAAADASTQTGAETAIKTIDDALKDVSAGRSKLGAYQNRLEHTINNLDNASENLTASESRVRDVDMAKEMMNFSKNNILQQAAQAMLSQANQQPQNVLQLLR